MNATWKTEGIDLDTGSKMGASEIRIMQVFFLLAPWCRVILAAMVLLTDSSFASLLHRIIFLTVSANITRALAK